MFKSAHLNKNGFFLLLVALLLLNLGALALSSFNENQLPVQAPAKGAAANALQQIELQGSQKKEILLQAGASKKFVSCSTGWEETGTPNFYFCASKKKYDFCQSLELDGKKCDNFNGVKNGGNWVEFDLGNNEKKQMIFSANTIFEDDSSGKAELVPFYEKHKLSVKDGDFKMQWGKNNNDAEIKLSFGIDGQVYTIAGLKTLDAGIDVKTFAKNLGGGTKIWYEVKNVPQEIRDKLEFIKMGFAPQAGFQKEQIRKDESDTKEEVILPEQLGFDLTDLKESGFDVSFENDYTVVVKAGESGWSQDIVLDPIFQSSSVAEDVYLRDGSSLALRIFMKINISSVPAGRTINSANLQMNVTTSSDDNDYTFYHLDQNQLWTENDSAANIWAMRTATFQSVTNCYGPTGDQNCAITTVFQAAYNAGDTNFSFRMEDPDNNAPTPNTKNNGVSLITGENSAAAVQKVFDSSEGTKSPILFVDYSAVNTAPDVNISKIDGWIDSDTLPVFGYTRDGNLTIDVNVKDSENDRLTIDLNYATTSAQGSGTAFYTDLNLTTSSPANCDDLDFTDSTRCRIDLNIFNFGDTNWYILANIKDGSLNDFNASDNKFKIDNNAPTSGSISVSSASWPANAGYTNTATPTFTLSATDANGMAFSCDGTTYSSYTSYATSYSSFNTKTGAGCTNTDGNKTIRVKYQDTTGNNSSAASTSSFYVDTTGPTFGEVQPGSNANYADTTPDLNIVVSDSTKWYCTARPFINGVAQADENGTMSQASADQTCAYTRSTALNANDTILVQFRATDKAGNVSADTNTATYTIVGPNSAPDVNVTKIDGWADNTALPVFGYTRDGNLTIDINVQDPNNDRLLLDINYSTTNTQGSGTALYTDLNLTTSAPANCDDLNFQDSTECSIDLNIFNFGDTNWYILTRVDDSHPLDVNLNDFNASDNSFKIDNNGPVGQAIGSGTGIIVTSWTGITGWTNTATPPFTLSATDANGMKFSCDQSTYSSYVAYAASYSSFNVRTGAGCTDADGTKSAYVKFQDTTGNTNTAALYYQTSSFTLDTNSPILNSPLPASNASITNTSPDLNIAVVPTTNNWYCRVRPFKGGVAQTDENASLLSGRCLYTKTGLTAGDTILAQFKLFDNAGNSSADTNTATYTIVSANSAPDVNVTKIDGWADNTALPVFGYTRDGNLTIDINVQDPNNDRLLLDINYSTTNTQGSGTALYTDLNLTTSAPANCDDLNFQDSTECSIDLNIFNFGDTNWYILTRVDDTGALDVNLNDFNASDNSFKIDNNGPTSTLASVSSFSGATGYANDTTPAFTLSATDANGMAFSCDGTTYSSYTSYATSYSSFNTKTGAGCTNSDGNKTIRVKYQDTAGNTSSAASTGSFVVDETTPTASSISAASSGLSGYTSQEKPAFTISASDSTAGLKDMSFACDTNKVQLAPTEDVYIYKDGASPDSRIFMKFNASSIPTGSKIVSAKLQMNVRVDDDNDDYTFYHLDQNQGWTESNTAIQIRNMSTGTFQSVTSCYSSTGDQNCTITAVLQASNLLGDANFSIKIEDPDHNSTATISTLTDDENLKTAYVPPTDVVGSYTDSKTFFSSEGTTSPKLFVEFIDANTNAANFAASYSDFNVATGAGCANTDGNKTVYLVVRDRANNISSTANTGSFVLDRSAPSLGAVSPSANSDTTNTTPAFSAAFTESNPWYCTAKPFVNGAAQADVNATISSGSCNYTRSASLAVNDTIRVQFKLTDNVGNSSSDSNTGIYTITGTGSTTTGGQICGDHVCNGTETLATCPTDCVRCGDGACSSSETAAICPQDCTGTTCGNRICEVSETYAACPADCPKPSHTCQELNGTACSQIDACSGSWLNATDSAKCCLGSCFADPDLTVELHSDPIIPENGSGLIVATIYNKGGAAGPFEVVLKGPPVSTTIASNTTTAATATSTAINPAISGGTWAAATKGPPKEKIAAQFQGTTTKDFEARQSVNGLGALSAVSVQFSVKFDSSWAYSSKDFTVTVDPANAVKEKDESNNSAKATIYFGGKEVCGNNKDDNGNGEVDEDCGIPDLYVKEATVERANPRKTGKIGVFNFKVVVGVKYACVENVKFAMFEANGSTPLSTIVIDELCPNQEKTLAVEYDLETEAAVILKLQDVGAKTTRILSQVNFVIDPDNAIKETSESNNFTLSAIKLPELRILELKSPQTVFYGSPFEITAVVDNNGFSASGDFDVTLSFENPSLQPMTKRVASMPSNTRQEIRFSLDSGNIVSQAELPKQFRFKLAVDTSNEAFEENELNNETASAFDIIENTIYFYDTFFAGENILVGLWAEKNEPTSNYSFTVTVFNPDGTSSEFNTTVIQAIVLDNLSSAKDFVIFELPPEGGPTGTQADGSIVPPNALSVKQNNVEIKSGQFELSYIPSDPSKAMENIYNAASDTSLLLKISPTHLKRMHYERLKNLNIQWWRKWYLG